MAANESDMLNEHEAADLLGFKVKTLRKWRTEDDEDGPPYIRIRRSIRYSRKALEKYQSENTVTPGDRR